jgi:uncharacterized coiled-coil protein SlyX
MRDELGKNLRAEVQSIDSRLARVVHDVDTYVILPCFWQLIARLRPKCATTHCAALLLAYLHTLRTARTVRDDYCRTVTAKLTECDTAILEQDSQLSALTNRLLNMREESQWQIEAAAAEAEACVPRPALRALHPPCSRLLCRI